MNKYTLPQLAFLMALLVSLPKIILVAIDNPDKVVSHIGWLDMGIQILFSFLYAYLFLYLNTFLTLNLWEKLAFFISIHLVLTFIFANAHLVLLHITERQGMVRIGYHFRHILIMLSSIVASNFLKTVQQKQTLLFRNKSLEAENLKAQLDTLQHQLNPHFLFNSLNSLQSLMREDIPKSQLFVENLSAVLRYSLDNQQKSLVTFEKEAQLLEAYLYLLKIRFGEKLIIEKTNFDAIKGFVPPLALQLLVENAVNHNEVSTKKPLTILLIYDKNKQNLHIINNLSPKRQNTVTQSVMAQSALKGSGLGLLNLNNRYELLSQKSIEIIKNEQYFEVIIPIISHENSYH